MCLIEIALFSMPILTVFIFMILAIIFTSKDAQNESYYMFLMFNNLLVGCGGSALMALFILAFSGLENKGNWNLIIISSAITIGIIYHIYLAFRAYNKCEFRYFWLNIE